ncbi:hypothetical protein EV361DRAFT_854341 [Lentinula raphanica]|nr:hypothetical protein EV361DRAFT_854341 [Lentinula raphanica]
MPRNIDESKKKLCPICGQKYSPNTFNRHYNSCKTKAAVPAQPFNSKPYSYSEDLIPPETPSVPTETLIIDFDAILKDHPSLDSPGFFLDSSNHGAGISAQYDHGADSSESRGPNSNDIRIQYHPKSGRPSSIVGFEDFIDKETPSHTPIPPSSKPWHPWQSRTNFEVAALALECFMNERQTNKLIALMHRVARGLDQFTLKDHNEVQRTWDLAADRSTKFQREEISVQYRNEEPNTYELFYRPIWDWLMELVSNKDIVSRMEWDAQQLFKFNDKNQVWMRFINEAWTANQWWAIQDRLPAGSVPICIVFYADKSKLSSFGTAKGYPVIVRCANLPMDIRNGAGLAGGRVVGWLPVVTEDALRSGKADFANFKNIVWHTSISKLFEGLTTYTSTGYTRLCGDDVRRTIFPVCLIESSDFEEQSVICLTRGTKSLAPCVKCLIPLDQLNNLQVEHTKRTAQETVAILNEARKSDSKGAAEDLLKKYGLRPHFNAFFELANGDPFAAASFDDLHFQDSGLWGDHIFEEVKFQLDRLPGASSRAAKSKIDERFKNFPRWPKLHHFESGVTKLSFNDGTKHRDISRLFLFAAHDVIVESKTKAGYRLLRIMRRYINAIMYAGLDIHTSETIDLGRASVCNLAEAINVSHSFKVLSLKHS